MIRGRGGTDWLYGDWGNDVIHGGDGPNSTTVEIRCCACLKRSTGDDELFGNDGDDRLAGWTGKDSLNGGDGTDTLDGGNNDDRGTLGEVYE